jgi:hypothetical protein
MSTTLLACLILIIVPIIAVQYPRHHSAQNAERAPADTAYFDGAAERTPPPPHAEASSSSSSSVQGASRRAPATAAGDVRGRGGKKPWDPPFEMGPKREGMYRVLRPSRDTVGGKGKERQVVEDEYELVDGHVPATEPLDGAPPRSLPSFRVQAPTPPDPRGETTDSASKMSPSPAPVPIPAPTGGQIGSRCSLVQSIVLVLASIFLIFAFAILIAHCLAWFIVYKTESRLGEVRKGLLRGGDMRVCLCAHG